MNAPAGTGGLPPSKRALLELRLRKATGSRIHHQPRPTIAEPAPLTYSQQRIWLTQQLEPDSPICNRPAHLRLLGALDHAVLCRSLEEIVRRHQVLRSTFSQSAGQVTQQVKPVEPIELPLRDLSHLLAEQAEREATRLADEQFADILDLKTGPLLRPALVRLAEYDHILLLTIHHIAFDAWSMSVFKRELAEVYGALVSNRTSSLPELPIQYADFALWQRELGGDGRMAEQLDYFKQKLAGPLPVLDLPTDFQRPMAPAARAARAAKTLSPSLCDAVKTLAATEGVTLFILILAAFKALICRYTGATDVVVGSPVAGRSRADAEQLIGCFINMLALRTDLSGDPPFRELLGRVKETALGAYANQDVPIELLIQELRPQRDVSRIPLFNVLFNYRNVPRSHQDATGLRIENFERSQPVALLDLSLELADSPDGLQCAFEYDADLFDPATIEGMLRHLEMLLKGIVTDPSTPISRIPLLDEQERARVLVEFNQTTREFPRDRCLHELITESAAQRPEAIAIRAGSKRMTYRELDQRADELAAVLRSLGVGPNVPVGLCLDRSCELIVGILGILRAGGAYVPIDPTYPAERIKLIRDDARFTILVTQQSLSDRFHEEQLRLVFVDKLPAINGDELDRPQPPTPGDLCYIVYTSGSTGTPKGVAIQHRSVVNYVTATYAPLGLKETDTMLQFASVTFDASVEDIFCPLARGATIVLRSEQMLGSVSTFLHECGRENVTVVVVPTSYFHELAGELAAGRAKLPRGLRMVVIGGEALLPHRLTQWHRAVGGSVRLINLYGPTETTVSATMWDCAQWLGRDGPLPLRCPIGRAAPNCQVYLLDTHLDPVPVGMAGELYVGGEGMARGYLNQPALTVERFIPHPFDECPGRRLFRTGDLGRRLPDGNIEFLGRADQQVKIRGFRIEPGEIESTLLQYPQISDAAVVAWDEATDKRLAAYVVPQPNSHPSPQEIREFVSQRLPSYMIPAAIVVSQRLATTAAGKIDRRSLPKPNWAESAEANASPIYRDTVEETLASIWSEVLNAGRIGVDENFFDLGGHSLLAVRLLSLVNDTFKVDLTPAAFFADPTIAQMARLLQSSSREYAHQPVVCLNQGAHLPPLFYLHGDFAGQGLYCANLARHLDARQPFYVLHTLGTDGRPCFDRIEQMADYHLRQIRSVRPAGPYSLGGFCNGGAIAFEIARRLREEGQDVPLVVLIASALDQMRIRPFFRIVHAVGGLIGVPFDSQVSFSLWVQKKRRRWRQVARNGFFARARLAVRKASILAQRAIGGTQRTTSLQAESTTELARSVRRLSEHYHLSMAGYDPKPYAGRVIVLWPNEEVHRYRRDPTLGWRRIAPMMEVRLIPGHHTTCLTLHCKHLATQLSSILADLTGG